jgi:preprotein translocase subunit SecD
LGVARRLAILLDGQVQSAPTVQSTIYDRGQISGSFSEEEAAEIVAVLNAGALPAVLRRLDVRQQKPGTAAARRGGSSRP